MYVEAIPSVGSNSRPNLRHLASFLPTPIRFARLVWRGSGYRASDCPRKRHRSNGGCRRPGSWMWPNPSTLGHGRKRLAVFRVTSAPLFIPSCVPNFQRRPKSLPSTMMRANQLWWSLAKHNRWKNFPASHCWNQKN
jgi:hypothetical protein